MFSLQCNQLQWKSRPEYKLLAETTKQLAETTKSCNTGWNQVNETDGISNFTLSVFLQATLIASNTTQTFRQSERVKNNCMFLYVMVWIVRYPARYKHSVYLGEVMPPHVTLCRTWSNNFVFFFCHCSLKSSNTSKEQS